jgi:hypothetical protein
MAGDLRLPPPRVSVSLMLLLFAGCGSGDPGPMSGRLLLAGRDIDNLSFWKSRTLSFTRPGADSPAGALQDLFVWRLDEPAPTLALAGIDWMEPGTYPQRLAGDLLVTGPLLERVYDVGSGQAANLSLDFPASPGDGGVAGGATGYAALSESIAMRPDGQAFAKLRPGGSDTVIVGRPPDLQAFTVPGGGDIGGMAFLGADLALLVRQPTAEGDVVGVQRLDTASGAFTPLVAATPAAEWTRVTGFCGEAAGSRCGLFRTVGCDIGGPSCPDGRPPACLIAYGKVDPADPAKVAGYVYDVGTATTARLEGTDVGVFFSDRKNHLLVWSAFAMPTRYWNVCTGVKGACDTWFSPDLEVAWRPDGGAFAMHGLDDVLFLVNTAEGSCPVPDFNRTYNIRQAEFAPGSDRLFWVAASEPGSAGFTLWLADGIGNSPVALVTGAYIDAAFSGNGRVLYVSHRDASTFALGWIDLTASPPSERILSTNHGVRGLRGNRRALFVDHYNAQDGNGELVLVELATGARQTLARAVTDVAVFGALEEGGTDVAYTVRGRAASARDGLWLTTLPP